MTTKALSFTAIERELAKKGWLKAIVKKTKKSRTYAIAAFYSDVYGVVGGGVDIQVCGSWFAEGNAKRKTVDAVLYTVRGL